jgi:hypothetical protein
MVFSWIPTHPTRKILHMYDEIVSAPHCPRPVLGVTPALNASLLESGW